jgi:hypothetical protein
LLKLVELIAWTFLAGVSSEEYKIKQVVTSDEDHLLGLVRPFIRRMGAWISTQGLDQEASTTTPGQNAPMPAVPSSPPHPSRSTFTQTQRPRPRTALSYFLPNPTPELQHSHSSPTIQDIHETIDILSTKLPPELVSRVLDEGRYWAGNRVLLKKELDVAAALPHSTRIPRESGWRNGQEEGVRLEEGVGEVWYLLSEAVGSVSAEEGDSSLLSANGVRQSRTRDESDEEEEEGEEKEGEEEEGCWLREIVIETLSKDQGWSSAVTANPALYGQLRHPLVGQANDQGHTTLHTHGLKYQSCETA